MKIQKSIALYPLVVVFCLFSFTSAEVDIYSVIRVMGSIAHVDTGKVLFTGDKVRSNEKLNFKTNTSTAAVISSLRGRFVLTATTGVVSASLLPAMGKVSSRAGALINLIDLQSHFEGKYLLLEGYEVEISEKSFPMNESNFFFLRYDYNGESISKKIPFEGNKIKMLKKDILTIDGRPIELEEGKSMALFYRNSEQKTSTKIADFIPVFVDNNDLKTEIKIILQEFEGKTNSEKADEINAYLNENYGKPHKDNLTAWLKTNFNIE